MRKFSVEYSWLAAVDMLDWPIAAGSPRSSPKICYTRARRCRACCREPKRHRQSLPLLRQFVQRGLKLLPTTTTQGMGLRRSRHLGNCGVRDRQQFAFRNQKRRQLLPSVRFTPLVADGAWAFVFPPGEADCRAGLAEEGVTTRVWGFRAGVCSPGEAQA
jgi:hypothetical protein